ncbi:MotA/TolQ/ExbB proton channel family protein [Bilophila wadsworthia]|uniref:MotA/TolQ/ExbB proton channel family protein n=1 Tax=Bilophila wadsworthia TaxID=35833 RepID=UPI0026DC71AE|nr:MotA/TolQ/ExbB proton channel family protein [Bilophila wadsworthia]
MGLIELGGWMMWPLLAVSVAALAIVVERALVFMGCPFPDSRFPGLVLEAMRTGDVRPLAARLEAVPSLRDFAALLGSPLPNREAALRLAGETVLERLEARLSLLSVLARLAPLMGLLGTILGMITTFSRIAEARSGVDMSLLAGGIWQALLTTAAGLCIAIPALFFLSCFQGKVRRVADALNKAGNAALLADGGPGITVRAGAEPLQPGDIPRGGGTARPTPEGTAEGDSCPESPEPRGSAPEGREALQCRDNAGEGLPDGERSC